VENGGFLRLLLFGTTDAKSLAWPQDQPSAASGRLKMINVSNFQQVAVSALGALFAAALFISAAVGPATQLV
jgi:hypothetical protein